MKSSPSKSQVQGEGDYAAARKYNEKTQDYVDSGKVDQAARDSEPRNAKEKSEMKQAEAEGRSHAKSKKADSDDRSPSGQPRPEKRAPGKSSSGKHPAR